MTLPDQLLIDQYIAETLTANERKAVEERMEADVVFKSNVNEQRAIVEALKTYGARNALQQKITEYHNEIDSEPMSPAIGSSSTTSFIKRQWRTIAIAATVSAISIFGTLVTLKSFNKNQHADYKELRKNVEQIKKSQKVMMADLQEVKEKNDPSPGNYEGTGFLISDDGYVATSYHVIADADSLYLENKKFGKLKASIVKADQKNDVAILKITQATFSASIPYTISVEESPLGDGVFTLGYPREDIVYSEGTISSSTGFRNNEHAYQIAVPVNPGNSGGPLLNSRGQLVGMVSGLQTETQGAAFAVKSSVLLDVLKKNEDDSVMQPITLNSKNRLRSLNRVEQIKRVQNFVFVVRVYNSK